jgi:hypothetical protein
MVLWPMFIILSRAPQKSGTALGGSAAGRQLECSTPYADEELLLSSEDACGGRRLVA